MKGGLVVISSLLTSYDCNHFRDCYQRYLPTYLSSGRSAHQISLHLSPSVSTSIRLTLFSNISCTQTSSQSPSPENPTQHFSLALSSASRPPSTQPTESCQPFRIIQGDLAIKVANRGAWINLELPSGDNRHNSFKVMLDGGITITQRKRDIASICKAKLIVE